MQSFQPPRRILMGPGPSDVSPRVLSALARPTIGHLDPEFQALMEEIKAALQRLFNAPDHACVPLPAPGKAGMEAAIMNLLEPGDRAVIAVNGALGGRMADMAGRAGATVVTVEHDWGQAVDVTRCDAAFRCPAALCLSAATSRCVRAHWHASASAILTTGRFWPAQRSAPHTVKALRRLRLLPTTSKTCHFKNLFVVFLMGWLFRYAPSAKSNSRQGILALSMEPKCATTSSY